MSFAAPAALWGLLLLPALAALHLYLQRRRARYAISFTNLSVLAGVLPARSQWRRAAPAVLYVLALSALLLGLARPHASISVPREQATVVLAIDTSGSMDAEDVEPTRLTAAQEAARSFLEQLPQEFQVGLVAFSDRAQILAQPTTDRTAVRDAIASLEAVGGTAMGDALAEALTLEKDASRTASRDADAARGEPPLDAVLLLSDGYNTTGRLDPLEAADRARRLGIPAFTIALGTPEGVVEGQDQFGRPRIIRVPPDHDTLRAIADATGAGFFTAPTHEDLERVYVDLGSRIGSVTEQREVTAAFAGAALLLAGLGGGLALAWTGRLP